MACSMVSLKYKKKWHVVRTDINMCMYFEFAYLHKRRIIRRTCEPELARDGFSIFLLPRRETSFSSFYSIIFSFFLFPSSNPLNVGGTGTRSALPSRAYVVKPTRWIFVPVKREWTGDKKALTNPQWLTSCRIIISRFFFSPPALDSQQFSYHVFFYHQTFNYEITSWPSPLPSLSIFQLFFPLFFKPHVDPSCSIKITQMLPLLFAKCFSIFLLFFTSSATVGFQFFPQKFNRPLYFIFFEENELNLWESIKKKKRLRASTKNFGQILDLTLTKNPGKQQNKPSNWEIEEKK